VAVKQARRIHQGLASDVEPGLVFLLHDAFLFWSVVKSLSRYTNVEEIFNFI
jgi:hypothetical protein